MEELEIVVTTETAACHFEFPKFIIPCIMSKCNSRSHRNAVAKCLLSAQANEPQEKLKISLVY